MQGRAGTGRRGRGRHSPQGLQDPTHRMGGRCSLRWSSPGAHQDLPLAEEEPGEAASRLVMACLALACATSHVALSLRPGSNKGVGRWSPQALSTPTPTPVLLDCLPPPLLVCRPPWHGSFCFPTGEAPRTEHVLLPEGTQTPILGDSRPGHSPGHWGCLGLCSPQRGQWASWALLPCERTSTSFPWTGVRVSGPGVSKPASAKGPNSRRQRRQHDSAATGGFLCHLP